MTPGWALCWAVGAGLAGAATAWQLIRRGHEVTVLERSTPANAEGSSHGSARILRYAYPDPFYARLAVDARAEWDDLERRSGERLVTLTGSLDYGDARDPAALADVFAQVGVEHELLTAAAAAARWPRFDFSLPGGRDALLPDGRSGQKVAEYNGGRPIRSAAERNAGIDPANRERVAAYVRRNAPGLVPVPYAETTCLFTNTPTEDFVIDGADGITVASPCSGHGAKFAPLIGRIIAESASGERPAPERFRVGG